MESPEQETQETQVETREFELPPVHETQGIKTAFRKRGKRTYRSEKRPEHEWKPHAMHIEPRYTECGPDWSSSLRYIPAPANPNHRPLDDAILLEMGVRQVRPFSRNWRLSHGEYDLYDGDARKRCIFDGYHLRSGNSGREVTDLILFGKKKRDIEMRNTIPEASPGDKNYQAVEYSPEFYKLGPSVPLANFGVVRPPRDRTTVDVPYASDSLQFDPYNVQEKRRQRASIVQEVRDLDKWRPASPLTPFTKVVENPRRLKALLKSK